MVGRAAVVIECRNKYKKQLLYSAGRDWCRSAGGGQYAIALQTSKILRDSFRPVNQVFGRMRRRLPALWWRLMLPGTPMGTAELHADGEVALQAFV